jgi:ABC-type branched-subunit amino acid transport system substrate-binding protein
MKKWIFFLFIVTSILTVYAQEKGTEYVLFDQGVKFYIEKNYKAAESTFLKLSSEFPDSPIASATYLMLMRTQYQLKKYSLAEASGHLILKKFPFSRYKDDAYYWLGNIKFQLKQYQKGVMYWLLAFKTSDDKRLKKILSNYLNKAMTNVLSEEDLYNLANKLDDRNLRILVRISLSRKLIMKRKYTEAYGILKKIKTEYPANPFMNIVNKILDEIPFEKVITGRYIMISMPQGESQNTLEMVGHHFVEGFQFAIRQHQNLFPESEVKTIIVNDSNSIVKSIPTILNVISKYDIWVNVGSLANETTAGLELISRYNHIPLISPIANHKNLRNIFNNFFQINPDPFTKGKTLGEYAKEHLSHQTIAIIAPDDDYGHDFVKGFQTVFVDSDSVSYLDVEYFTPDTKQFIQQLSRIRFLSQLKTFRDSIMQEQPELSEEELLSMYEVWLNEKVETLKAELMKNVDSLDIPMKNIDLFVAAIYPDQVQAFASQFAFYNFKTQLLGNEGWYNQEELDKVNSAYINNLIFISPIFIQQENWEFKNFRNKFRTVVRKTPDKYHLLGYNIGLWLAKAIDLAETKDDVERALLNTDDVKFIGMKIQFSKNSTTNVNHYLNFIQYKYGRLFQLK